jgi:predicted HicB family RNase H-like nuclease
LSRQNKLKKVGRPKLPKGKAKGKIVPIRFTDEAYKAIEAQAEAQNQTVSEWIRGTINAEAKF